MSLSVYGRPYEERDPNGGWDEQHHAYGLYADLYDYSRGAVFDAAKKLGIKNVNSYDEVWQILDQIRNPTGSSDSGSNQSQPEPNYTNPTPSNPDPRRFTGEFDDIKDVLKDEFDTAAKEGVDIANREVQQIDTPSVDDVLEEQANTPSIDDRLSTILESLTLDFENRYSGLEDLLVQQQTSFQSSFDAMAQQKQDAQSAFQASLNAMAQQRQDSQAALDAMAQQSQAAQAAYQQQLLLAQNAARAYVPQAERSAATAQIGDQRETSSRKAVNNNLSSLTILSGLGTASNPLSGLQLA